MVDRWNMICIHITQSIVSDLSAFEALKPFRTKTLEWNFSQSLIQQKWNTGVSKS
jgi:hypothetical protein